MPNEEKEVAAQKGQPVDSKVEVKEEQQKVEETKAETKKEETETKEQQQKVIPAEKVKGEIDIEKIGEPEKPEEHCDKQDNSKIQELESKNEELKKALDAVASRIAALEDALSKSGVMKEEKPQQPIGASGFDITANNPAYDAMSDVLKHINSYKR